MIAQQIADIFAIATSPQAIADAKARAQAAGIATFPDADPALVAIFTADRFKREAEEATRALLMIANAEKGLPVHPPQDALTITTTVTVVERPPH
ncbi:MAG: hypothetical protein KDH17_09610 [Rhodocyclaceae bacterium]|nr:hypothetical protein [Rhodocyclaceae bacterium]MCP5234788.1 hypothetical protein [Zoogloeaceae bacterium]